MLTLPSTPALAQAGEHLGGDEERLEERAGAEAARERAEEARGVRRVFEPPEVVHAREAVDVYVVRGDQLKQPESAVRAAEAALFDAAPGRLRDAVRVEDF